MIQNFYKHCFKCKEIFCKTEEVFSTELKTITQTEKRKNEIKMREYIENIKEYVDNFPISPYKKIIWRKKGEKFLDEVIENDNIFNLQRLSKNTQQGVTKTTKKFIRKARDFDKNLDFKSIFQALRNVWIIGIIQEMINGKQKYSSAIFGYSMLYPYTDNFLDDNLISYEEKMNFNLRFYKRLNGEVLKHKNDYEEKIFRLVENIEKTFRRDKYNRVYESLLLIHKGQNKSLTQHLNSDLDEEDLLDISIEKGGASVLVDGFLVNGSLTFEESNFLIGYGFFLQIGDDIQDSATRCLNKAV